MTATTVGYGGLSAATVTGRAVAMVLMHSTTLLVMPLLTAEIAAKLIVDSYAFTHDEQEEIKRTLRRLEETIDAMWPEDATVRSALPRSAPTPTGG